MRPFPKSVTVPVELSDEQAEKIVQTLDDWGTACTANVKNDARSQWHLLLIDIGVLPDD